MLSVNPNTLIPEIDEIIETQVFHYKDDLYCFRNGKQIDLKVTKNHRFLVKQGHKPASLMEAAEIERWTNISIPRLNTPNMIDDDSIISLAVYRGLDRFAVSLPITVTGRHADSEFSDLWEYVSKLGYLQQAKQIIPLQ